jgi:hypothetical protein
VTSEAAPSVSKLLKLAEASCAEAVTPAAPGPEESDRPQPIGIWSPREHDGSWVFERSPPNPIAEIWSSLQQQLTTRSAAGQLRVCLIGESVSAADCYAPAYTTAKLLASCLSEVTAPERFDVIDLSRMGMTLEEIELMVSRASQLNPDIIVVFAGNNWGYSRGQLPDGAVAAYREAGFPGLRALQTSELAASLTATVERVGAIATARGIRLVWAIPEINLLDWESPMPPAWFPGGATPEWHRVHRQVERAIREARFSDASIATRRLLELDAGTCPTSARLAAVVQLALGDEDGARAWMIAEADASACNPWLPEISRCCSFEREAIRKASRATGHTFVDLREVLRKHSALPGRELFLDHVHLRAAGLRLAVAAIAREVLRICELAAPDSRWSGWLEHASWPDPELESTANVVQATRYALLTELSRSRSGELVRYWLDEALKVWPGAFEHLAREIEVHTSPLPGFLHRLARSPMSLAEPPAGELIAAVWELASRPNDPLRATLVRNVGVRGALDLSQSYFNSSWCARFAADLEPMEYRNARTSHSSDPILRAPWSTSRFFFVVDAPRPLNVTLTARMTGSSAETRGTVWLALNDARVGGDPVGATWTSKTYVLPRDRVKGGVNWITVEWPALSDDGDQAMAAFIDQLEQGLPALPYPVFGEIFSLVVCPQ